MLNFIIYDELAQILLHLEILDIVIYTMRFKNISNISTNNIIMSMQIFNNHNIVINI